MDEHHTFLKKSLYPLGIILLISCLARFINIFNDGIYSDGWAHYHLIRGSDFNTLKLMYQNVGLSSLPAYFFWFLGKVGNFVFISRLTTFFILLALSVIIYLNLQELMILSMEESVLCALIATTYPAFLVEQELWVCWVLLCLLCFYIGIYLYQISLRYHNSLIFFLLLTGSIFFLFISFNLNSLLVYFFALISVIHCCYYFKRKKNLPKRHFFIYIIAPIFWIIKLKFCPKIEHFSYYNSIIFNPFEWLTAFSKFILHSINQPIASSAYHLLSYPILFIFTFGLTKLFKKINSKNLPPKINIKDSTLFIIGVWLFLLSIGAYVLVGKGPSPIGWDSRHSILISLPVALMIIASVRVVNDFLRNTGKQIVLFFLLSLTTGFLAVQWGNSMLWQLNWIRDKTIIVSLREHPEWSKYSIYIIRDDTKIPIVAHYHSLALSGILKEAWGNETRMGINANWLTNEEEIKNQIQQNLKNHLPWDLIKDINSNGEEIVLKVRRKADLRDLRIFGMYYYYKYFNSSELEPFLKTLFSIDQISINQL